MTMSPSSAAPSSSSSNGESFSSLPRWRQLLSMLNWRRDPDYEQRKMQHEWRMKQLEKDIEQIEKETKQIERETERLKQENAREKALSALIKQHCFPPESSSIPASATEPDSKPSSP
jgi:septal ring factor EnvC (AmiA/AmiB activator)